MAFTEGFSSGTTSGTSAVTMVSPPGSGSRIVKTVTIKNTDTANATVIVQYDTGSNVREMFEVLLNVGDMLIIDEPIVVIQGSIGLQIKLGGAVTTNQLDYTAHYGDSN